MVVVGSANVDYLISVDRRPVPGETVMARGLRTLGGGKGANQAFAAALAGAEVHFVACVGDDALGEQRMAELASVGVRTALVRRAAGSLTGLAFITVTPDGENDIIVAPGANAALGREDVDAAAHLLAGPCVLLAQLEVPHPATARAIELAGPQARVVLNLSPWRRLPAELLGRVDVLVVNEVEAAAMWGSPVGTVAEAMEAGRALRGAGPSAVVVTLGAAGAVAVADGLEEHVPSPPVEVVDTTGAGDAFAGALAARRALGYDLLEAVRYGAAMGSATTSRLGAQAVAPGTSSLSC